MYGTWCTEQGVKVSNEVNLSDEVLHVDMLSDLMAADPFAFERPPVQLQL